MAEKRKVKVGVVGCGVVATAYYLPYLMKMPAVELVAVCDIDPARTSACVRLFGAREQYQDYYEMIRTADIEAVFILTGPGTHTSFTLAAVAAGKHLVLQKPMALTMHDTNTIVAAVRQAGVKAIVEPSSNTPLEPAYRECARCSTGACSGILTGYLHTGLDGSLPCLAGQQSLWA